jgi:hypothetical protein
MRNKSHRRCGGKAIHPANGDMITELFTVEAALMWDAVPQERRTEITLSVWCPRCKQRVPMGNIRGSVKKGDLLLKGGCGYCFKSISTVIKAEEAQPGEN